MTESQPETDVPLAPAAVVAAAPKSTLVASICTVPAVGWTVLRSVGVWRAYSIGITDLWAPLLTTAFALGLGLLALGVVRGDRSARMWMIAAAVATGLNEALLATQSHQSWPWIGVAAQLPCVVSLVATKHRFAPARRVFVELGKTFALIGFVGGFVLGIAKGATHAESGTERGRQQFAADLQAKFDGAGGKSAHVSTRELDMLVDAPSYVDLEIDDLAASVHTALAKSKSNAKAWLLGFHRIVVTNGHHERVLTPADPD